MPVIKSEKQSKRVSAGRCPHCRLLFRNPLTLTCGHSLCASCCQELLERRSDSETSDNEKTQPTMRTPVMGSRIMSEFNASLTPKRFSMAIRAPECPVCGNAPSYQTPIKNHALTQVIKLMSRRKRSNLATYRNPLYSLPEKHETTSPRPSSSSSGFDEIDPDVNNVCISKLNISIVGSNGVGKSTLTRTQYLNNLFFGQINCEKGSAEESSTELFAKYLIHIIDQSDLTKSLIDAHGFIFLYSITDKDSFNQLSELINQVKTSRKDDPGIIIVGTKSDLISLRQVSSFEGQQLARSNNCPYFEVSAKENDCVNEVFNQLVQIIDTKYQNGM